MNNEADKIEYINNQLIEQDLKTNYILVAGKDESDLKNLLEDLKEYIVELDNNSEIDIQHNFDEYKTYIAIKEGYTRILSNYWKEDKIYVACVGSIDNYINGIYEKLTKKDLNNKGFTKWGLIIDTNHKERKKLYDTNQKEKLKVDTKTGTLKILLADQHTELATNKVMEFEKIKDLKCFRDLKESKKFERQLGTLGGGNHFIELDVDDNYNKYLVIHTGSRNLGNQVAECHQKLAIKLHSGYDDILKKQQEIIDTYKAQGRKTEIQEAIKQLHREMKLTKPNMPNDLCYLENNYRDDYLYDMKICQEYAICNRELIAKNIIEKVINPMLKEELIYDDLDKFQTIHNYISFDDNVVRKGAISAKKGERVLIPINMRDGSIIAVGKGNDEWNQSAPHGAGRIMSRNKAKETFKLEDFKESMKDVYTTSVVEETIDEAPFVYKPMQEIIDNIKDTVEIERIIKPIYNFKSKN